MKKNKDLCDAISRGAGEAQLLDLLNCDIDENELNKFIDFLSYRGYIGAYKWAGKVQSRAQAKAEKIELIKELDGN